MSENTLGQEIIDAIIRAESTSREMGKEEVSPEFIEGEMQDPLRAIIEAAARDDEILNESVALLARGVRKGDDSSYILRVILLNFGLRAFNLPIPE
jgi:hypothetical protein